MDDTSVNEAEEFAREISKELANHLTEHYPELVARESLNDVIFEYFKERNENRGRG